MQTNSESDVKNAPYTYDEILSQTEAWAESIRVVDQHRSDLLALWNEDFNRVLYSGCGSSYHLSQSVAAVSQELTSRETRAFPASELLLYPKSAFPAGKDKTLLIASSRSGLTTETVRAVEAFRKAGRGPVITIQNYPEAPLATMGDVNIVIPSGQERGVAQTRSFTAMYLANIAIASIFAGRDDLLEALEGLIPAGEGILRDYHNTAREMATDEALSQFFFLGSGPRHGLACEASLKLKEISLSICEPFHFMEFRHGPISMVNHKTLVVGLLSEATRFQEERVLEETRNLGARTLSIAERDADISFRSGLPEPVRGVLYLPALQLMAYHRAIVAGLDPDKPHNLAAVIELDLPLVHE